jgi:hypothetical protein
MADLNISIPHELSKEEALSRIKNLLTNLKKEQAQVISNVHEKWEGEKGKFQFSAKGFDLAGLIQVNENSVDIDAELPFALSFFKGMIKNVIQDRANSLLAKDADES